MNSAETLLFLSELASASGDLILSYYNQPTVEVETKADQTPVTIADRSAEELLRKMIKQRYPSHGIIGEEYGSENADAEYVWVLDPVDGTKSFIHHVPLFTTLIGLMHQGRPIAGAIHQPVTKMLALADSTGTFIDGRKAQVRKTKSLSEATVLLSGTEYSRDTWAKPGFQALLSKAKLYRTWGDGYGYMLVAAGYADIVIDAGLQIWDLCALIPVIQGAGGTLSSLDGGDAMKALNSVATNGLLHQEVLDTLARN